MKAKRFFANVVVLLIAAAAVFFIGWTQLAVKPGQCGIMTSKTGGVHPRPVKNGEFLWRWERLLPTNVTITAYPLAPYESTQEVSGELPAAGVYAAWLDTGADFSYRLSLTVRLSVTPEGILALFRAGTLTDETPLEHYLDTQAKAVAQAVAGYLTEGTAQEPGITPLVLSDAERDAVAARCGSSLGSVHIEAVQVTSAHLPDRALYDRARTSFSAYADELDAQLRVRAQEQAASLAQADENMRRLEQFAALLEKYPQLSELSKTGNLIEIMNQLRAMR